MRRRGSRHSTAFLHSCSTLIEVDSSMPNVSATLWSCGASQLARRVLAQVGAGGVVDGDATRAPLSDRKQTCARLGCASFGSVGQAARRSSYAPGASGALVGPRPVMPKLYAPGSRSRRRASTPSTGRPPCTAGRRGARRAASAGAAVPERGSRPERVSIAGSVSDGWNDLALSDTPPSRVAAGRSKPSAHGTRSTSLPAGAIRSTPVTCPARARPEPRPRTFTRAALPIPQHELVRGDLEPERLGLGRRDDADRELQPPRRDVPDDDRPRRVPVRALPDPEPERRRLGRDLADRRRAEPEACRPPPPSATPHPPARSPRAGSGATARRAPAASGRAAPRRPPPSQPPRSSRSPCRRAAVPSAAAPGSDVAIATPGAAMFGFTPPSNASPREEKSAT